MEVYRRIVVVNDRMQQGYEYEIVSRAGRDFHPDFQPDLSPKEMLQLGVFCGKYLTDCQAEFPRNWFALAKLAPAGRDCSLNYFVGTQASRFLSGGRRAGSTRMTHEGGFNGIAATTSAVARQRRMNGRLGDGRPSIDTSLN
jgi:hypothetical protein